MAEFVTLGTFAGRAKSVVFGARPRTIQTNTNCLAPEPVQTVAYVSDYQPVTVTYILQGIDTIGETAVEHLRRMRANLATEIAKDSNTLSIDWDDGSPETYRVFMNEEFDFAPPRTVRVGAYAEVTFTLNCLPT